jgi:amino acid adenylation domain-containing protein
MDGCSVPEEEGARTQDPGRPGARPPGFADPGAPAPETNEDFSHVEGYALSPIQQGMLFHYLRGEHAGVDIEQMVMELHEPLLVPAFERAWQYVTDRHTALRTGFRWEELAAPEQFVLENVRVPMDYFDWSALSPAEQIAKTDGFLRADRRRGFDLRNPPLVRLALFRLSDNRYRLIWSVHHLVIDGRSFAIVLKEVFAANEAACRGESLDWSVTQPYRKYIDWLEQQDLSAAEAFWRRRLRGFHTATPLLADPGALAWPADAGFLEEEICLSPGFTAELLGLAERENVTLNTLIQGSWALLLSRYSGESDVVFGATKTTRRSTVPGAESIVGLFLSTVPVRIRLSDETLLLDWLRELRANWISLRGHEHTPLVKIREWSNVPPGSPLFDSLVMFENRRFDSLLRAEGGAWLNRTLRLLVRTGYPLTLGAYAGSELLLKIQYDSRRFQPFIITQMLAHLRKILEEMAARPWQRLGEVSLLSGAESRKLLVEWNNTRADFPGEVCFHHLIEERASERPESVALVYEQNRLSYREMNARANQVAHHLRALGVGPDVCVGLCLERSMEMLIGLLGILKAGGAYVPLDPAYPPERLAFMLEDSRVPVLLTQFSLVPALPSTRAKILRLDSDWWRTSGEKTCNLSSGATPGNLAYVIYTSGSTGRPKGVQVEHRGLCNLVETQRLTCGAGPGDRVLQFCSLSFDPSIFEIGLALRSGATLVLAPQSSLLPGSALAQLLREQAITTIVLPPSVLAPLAGDGFPSLKTLIVGAEPVTAEFVKRWGSGRRIFNIYGATETTVFSTIAKCMADGRKPSIGKPIANTQVYLLDAGMRPVPVGIPGELYVGGVGVARGYLDRPELTAARFVPDPFSRAKGARLYRTGDMARYLPGGDIDFLGRADNQVKIRGHRIELEEIEATLAEHPAVRDCAVAVRGDSARDHSLAAYFVSALEPAPLAGELRSFLRAKLPAYMLPGVFIKMERLPLSPNGKVDRRALPSPLPEREPHDGDAIPPRDALERQLQKIWEEILDVRPIGIADDFFELGGHSLLAITLFARIQKVLGKKLPLTILYQASTIAGLAAILRQHEWRAPSLLEIQPRGSLPPFFCIRANLQFAEALRELGPEQPVFGLRDEDILARSGRFTLHGVIAEYAARIRAIQHQGPYYLGGHCLGGPLAFGIAQELERQGQRVAFLAIFEADSPRYRPELATGKAFLRYNAAKFPFHMRNLIALNTSGKLLYIRKRFRNFFKITVPRNAAAITNLFLLRIGCPVPSFFRERRLDRLARTQFLQPWSGSVTLFRTQWPEGGNRDSALGWGRFASGGVEVHEVPGDHQTMFIGPNARLLGQQLKDALTRAHASESAGAVQAVSRL